MFSRKRVAALWVGVGMVAIMALTLLSGAASPTPDLGSPLDLDEASQVQFPPGSSPAPTASTTPSPETTPTPSKTKRPVVVAPAAPPVKVPTRPRPAPPPPASDDDGDDGGGDDDGDDDDGEDDGDDD